MSRDQLGRSLRIIICNNNDNYRANQRILLNNLGHQVIQECAAIKECQTAIVAHQPPPDLLCTSFCQPGELREIQTTSKKLPAELPIIITYDETGTIVQCEELDHVCGICHEPVTEQLLGDSILLAIHRVKQLEKFRDDMKAIDHARVILQARWNIKTTEEAHKYLLEIAFSRNRSVPYQAKRITVADLEMQPRKSHRRKR